MKELSLEEKFARIKDLRPIDDVFFEVLASDIYVCQEILQTILEDKKLTVADVIVQSSERNLYGRSVRLDALCTLGNGTKCNIEVQRSDNDDHLKRARFNASSITVKESNVGEKFDDILDLYIVYISEFDFLKSNLTIYHLDKVIRENKVVVNDGLHEIFVNTTIDDGSDIAELMSCFTKKEVNDSKFPNLTRKVTELKSTEGGASAVCKVMEQYIAESKLEQLVELVKENLLSIANAALKAGMTEEEFKKLIK